MRWTGDPTDRVRNPTEAAPFAEGFSAFWAEPLDRLLEDLGSTRLGLSTETAAVRLEVHGRNALTGAPRTTLLRLFLRQFSNPLILILVVAAVVAALVHEPVDSLLILVVLLGSALLTLVQEHRSASAVARLRSMVVLRSTTLRDGIEREVPAEELVPGDVLLLAAGTLGPADGVLLDARDLFVNQGGGC